MIECKYNEMCEYMRVGSRYCDLTESERADCCPLNKIEPEDD